MMRPSASTKTCSARLITACITCSIISMVMPRVAERADDRHDVADLRRVEPGEHLIEQQQLRLGRERARKLEPLAPGDGEACGRTVEQVAEADRRGRPPRLPQARRRARDGADARRPRCSRARSSRRTAARSGRCGRCRAARSRCGGMPVTSCAGEADAACARRKEAGDQGEQRRLAGAVRADQRRDAAGSARQRRAVDGAQAAEAARHALDRESGSAMGGSSIAGAGARTIGAVRRQPSSRAARKR